MEKRIKWENNMELPDEDSSEFLAHNSQGEYLGLLSYENVGRHITTLYNCYNFSYFYFYEYGKEI